MFTSSAWADSLAATFTYTSVSGNVLYRIAAIRAQEQQEGKDLPAPPAGVPVGQGQLPAPERHPLLDQGQAVPQSSTVWHDIAAKPGERVIVCEGEGNADCICKLVSAGDNRCRTEVERECGPRCWQIATSSSSRTTTNPGGSTRRRRLRCSAPAESAFLRLN